MRSAFGLLLGVRLRCRLRSATQLLSFDLSSALNLDKNVEDVDKIVILQIEIWTSKHVNCYL